MRLWSKSDPVTQGSCPDANPVVCQKLRLDQLDPATFANDPHPRFHRNTRNQPENVDGDASSVHVYRTGYTSDDMRSQAGQRHAALPIAVPWADVDFCWRKMRAAEFKERKGLVSHVCFVFLRFSSGRVIVRNADLCDSSRSNHCFALGPQGPGTIRIKRITAHAFVCHRFDNFGNMAIFAIASADFVCCNNEPGPLRRCCALRWSLQCRHQGCPAFVISPFGADPAHLLQFFRGQMAHQFGANAAWMQRRGSDTLVTVASV